MVHLNLLKSFRMQRKDQILILLFLGLSFSIHAQKSTIYNTDVKDFSTALNLYNAGQFASAKVIFSRIKSESKSEEERSDCAFYSAVCAVRERLPNAQNTLEQFTKDYPTSAKKNQAYIELGNYCFQQNNFERSLFWYSKADENYVSSIEMERYHFQKAYTLFIANAKPEASTYFLKVLKSKNYSSQANYYLGFIAYENDNFKEAMRYFDAVSAEGKYKEKMAYYQADMNFKMGNFKKAIEYGIQSQTVFSPAEQSELNKIIGESYFNLNEYGKSIYYLKLYQGKNGKWNSQDFYQLGTAYFKVNEFEIAINQFNKCIENNDLIAQNAYYYLGQCYLNLNKKQEALNAFKKAAEMNFVPQIKEESSLNYAKLSYEIGNPYENVPDILSRFLKTFPDSSNKSEIEKLLIDSYVSSKNYKDALLILEKNNAPENKSIYQKVLLYSGLQYFTDTQYQEALQCFEKAIVEQNEPILTTRATFWKAETQFVLNDFKGSISSFKQFISFAESSKTSEIKNYEYNLAYAHFKIKEYDLAANYFQKQIEKGADKTRLADSYLRLADCKFVTSKYWQAMDAYAKSLENGTVETDYAYFQRTICYGFVNINDKKIENLISFLKLFTKSEYRDDALFELGNTYVAENKTDLALKSYNQLINENKKSSFVSKAILKQGLIYYNTDQDDLALQKLKNVVSEYPKSAEANEAVATIRLIYLESGKIDEYASWVKTIDFVSISDVELDNDAYEAAEKQYQKGNAAQAITGFDSYLKSFPKGIHNLKANFYLAQLVYATGQEEKASVHYENVVAEPKNEYTEPSLVRLAQIYIKSKNNKNAIQVLNRIEIEADNSQNKTFAQANLMKLYYENNEFSNALVYAEKVTRNPKTENDVKKDAQIVQARSAFKIGDDLKAKSSYEKLLSSQGELGAEALYYDAYYKNKELKFEASNVSIQSLAKNYSNYKYFGAKGLVLMAKNFKELKDNYQAGFILENVIKNFSNYSDVVAEAQTELNSLKTKK